MQIMGQLSGQVFQAHPIEKVWIRPWMCCRNCFSHLVCEHLSLLNLDFRHIFQRIQIYMLALKKLEVACCQIYVYLHFSQQPCVIFPFFTFPALLQWWGQKVLSSPLVSAGVTNDSKALLVARSTNNKQECECRKK